jgi:hypothetical protein
MQRIKQPTTEQMMMRKANLERKRKQRAREKARTSQAVHDYLEKIARGHVNGEGLARQAKFNLCTLGEIAPGVDATTIDEALTISREFEGYGSRGRDARRKSFRFLVKNFH